MDKESIEIVLQGQIKRDNSEASDSYYRDKVVIIVDATRDEVSKKLREFAEELENIFEH